MRRVSVLHRGRRGPSGRDGTAVLIEVTGARTCDHGTDTGTCVHTWGTWSLGDPAWALLLAHVPTPIMTPDSERQGTTLRDWGRSAQASLLLPVLPVNLPLFQRVREEKLLPRSSGLRESGRAGGKRQRGISHHKPPRTVSVLSHAQPCFNFEFRVRATHRDNMKDWQGEESGRVGTM